MRSTELIWGIDDMSEKDLIKKAKLGDSEAKKKFFEIVACKYQKILLSFIYKQINDIHEAFDVLQDVFETALLNLGSLKDNDKFSSWLYSIARNIIRQKIRSKKALEDLDKYSETIASFSDSPEEIAIKNDLLNLISIAVSKLTRIQREVIILYYFDQKSQKEISLLLNIPIGTVKRRIFDSISSIKKYLEGVIPEMKMLNEKKLEKELKEVMKGDADFEKVLKTWGKVIKSGYIPDKKVMQKLVGDLIDNNIVNIKEIVKPPVLEDKKHPVMKLYNELKNILPEFKDTTDFDIKWLFERSNAVKDKKLPERKINIIRVLYPLDKNGRIIEPEEMLKSTKKALEEKISKDTVYYHHANISEFSENVDEIYTKKLIERIFKSLFNEYELKCTPIKKYKYKTCFLLKMQIKDKIEKIGYFGIFKDEIMRNGGYDPEKVKGLHICLYLELLAAKFVN